MTALRWPHRAALVRILLTCALFLAGTRPALAKVVRYAIVVANNLGSEHDEPLHYAHEDAKRLVDALQLFGDVRPSNTHVLLEAQPEAIWRALKSVHAQISQQAPTQESLLIFYYSGHATSEALQMNGARLRLDSLRSMLATSPVNVRLLVLDACRSGTLTNVKGGRPTASFSVAKGLLAANDNANESLDARGLILLTSSAAGEDSQESQALRGSFFTHHLVSALRGTADSNRDGAVSLAEAYAYAYAQTVDSSSRTASGIQHPTFSFDARGRGDLLLTRPQMRDHVSGLLRLPPGLVFLIYSSSDAGRVVVELAAHATSREIGLQPGSYFLRGRSTDYVLEGRAIVDAGKLTSVVPDQLERIEFARLVRKGSSELQTVSGPWVGTRFVLRSGHGTSARLATAFAWATDWSDAGSR